MSLFPPNVEAALAGIPRGRYSNVYVVDPANGSDSNPGTKWQAPLASLEAAYAKCVTNQHDVVLYVAGSSGNNLAAALAWSKSYTHLIGLCAPTRVGQRARVFQTSTLTGASPLLTVSGSGCIFKDLYIFQGVNDATSLINVSVTGGRNYFENVHFAGGGHAAHAVDGGASLKLDGAEENTFKNCTVGVDTIAAATGFVNLLIDGDAKRNFFEDCVFSLYSDHTGAAFVEVADSAAFDRYMLFNRCLFLNSCSVGAKFPASAFVIPTGMGSVTHRIVLKDCSILGASEVDASNRGIVYLNTGAITAGGNSALMQASNAT